MKKLLIILTFSLLIVGSSILVYSETTGKTNVKSSISVDDAKDNVRKFIELPTAEINFRTSKAFPAESIFELNTSDSTFYVNTKTGEIEYARFDKSIQGSESVKLEMSYAKDIASKYAIKKYKGFSNMDMQLIFSDLIDHGDAGKEYVFYWNEIINNVYTPNSVLVTINPNNGEIITYIGSHGTVKIGITPQIEKEKAINIAEGQTRNILNQKIDARLQLININESTQKLIWVVDVKGNWEDNTQAFSEILVNAENGEVIPY
ncbi:MAG: Peptidase propeptide and YPEB domain protein [Methanocella sp. PtaU1.Bin125]|nr:MAG: Peptidase propeptide and YPEB domain protein [Methanocella sp. PtaU1.Bin125]